MRLLLTLCAAATLRLALPAHANDYQDCDQTKDLARQLSACTRIIADEAAAPRVKGAAHAKVCTLLGNIQEWKAAAESCKKANALLPAAANYANLGGAEYMTNDLEAALHDLNHALDLDPKLANAYLNRALVYEEMGGSDNKAKAAADREQADALGRKSE